MSLTVSTKNINNIASGVGGNIKNTDYLTEGSTNLYFTTVRVATAIASDPNYKNAESLFLVPINGPPSNPGQVLVYDGSVWQPTNDLDLNNSNLTVTAGPAFTPDAYYSRIGPIKYNKLAGLQKITSFNIPTNNMSGYISLFITAKDTANVLYQNSDGFFYDNTLGTVTSTYVSGFHSTAFTRNITGTTIEINLNTVLPASCTVTIEYQTVSGDNITTTVP
jgi:hypothetical protein